MHIAVQVPYHMMFVYVVQLYTAHYKSSNTPGIIIGSGIWNKIQWKTLKNWYKYTHSTINNSNLKNTMKYIGLVYYPCINTWKCTVCDKYSDYDLYLDLVLKYIWKNMQKDKYITQVYGKQTKIWFQIWCPSVTQHVHLVKKKDNKYSIENTYVQKVFHVWFSKSNSNPK